MSRRAALIGVLGLVIGVSSRNARAQTKMYRVGWLTGGSPKTHASFLAAFREGLREHGWVEGRNIVLELRWAEGNIDRLPALAAELVRLKPDVIVTAAQPVHLAVRKETSTIPIVMATGADPLSAGLVASLARPGGNVTGLSGFYEAMPIKMLELAAALVPRGARVTVLVDSSSPFFRTHYRGEVERTATAVGLRGEFNEVARPEDIPVVFAALAKSPPAAIVMLPGSMMFALGERMVTAVNALKVPGIYPFEETVEAGGLMSYSVNLPDSYRRAAYYVSRILKGAKPGDLPIEQPVRLSMTVNLKTAKAQGINFPREILLRADRVID